MTREQTPTYEQREETYREPTTEYAISFPGGDTYVLTTANEGEQSAADMAEQLSRAGCEVTATTGWE